MIEKLPEVALPASRERLMWTKINEIVQHINDLEEKLLSAEERMEAEDIKEANKALKRGKFVNFADLRETFGGLSEESLKKLGIY